jgi:hypothetical protein
VPRKPRGKRTPDVPGSHTDGVNPEQPDCRPADVPATAEQLAASFVARQASEFQLAQTAINKAKFIEAFSATGNVSAAAKLAGVGRRTHYDWLKEDEAYKVAFADAVDEAADRLEVEARRRAVTGNVKPVFHKGVQVGTVREYSDTLLIFLLKGARPEKYSERHVHSGKGKRGAILLEDIIAGATEDPAA